jgi:4-amino-4-deoxy-L-arabinose transferase-like glycosyltransferase
MGGAGWPQAGAVLCLALAILTKGPVAAGLVGAWLAALWLMGGASRREVLGLRLWLGLLGVCVLALPWFVWMYWQYGDLFLTGYLGQGHVGYFTPRASASSSDWAFYARMFMASFFPWSLIAVGYGIDTWRRRRRGAEIPVWERGLWLWMAVVLVAFTLVPFRVDRYIYPAAPACCLLAARGWLAASAEARWREFAATRMAMAAVAVIFVSAGVFLGWSMPRLALPLTRAAAILPAGLMIGGAAILVALSRRGMGQVRLAGWPIGTLLTAYATLVVFGLPLIRAGLPVEQVGRFVAERSGTAEPVAVLGLDRWQTGLSYYLHDPPQRIQTAVEAQRFANGPGPRWMIMRREWHKTVAPSGCLTLSVPAILGTTGRGIRTQVWGDVVVVRYDAAADSVRSLCPVP